MTYTPIKPDSGPSPLLDAPNIRTNFSQFASIFASSSGGINYNHTALNSANQGDHEVVLMEKQLIDPTVNGDETILYCKDTTSNIDTEPQLYVRIPKFLPTENDTTNAPNMPMQLTYNTVNTSGPVYQSFMAGGYIVYFGKTSNVAVNIVVSPAPTALLLAIATPFNAIASVGFDVSTNIINNTTFKINSAAAVGVYTFGWVAIGSA